MNTDVQRPPARRGRPSYMAHFVIRTSRVEETVAWYKTFLDADEVYEKDGLSFLTFDDEHHRVAVVRIPGVEFKDLTDDIAGVDHVAFTMADIDDFVAAYERNKSVGILPYWSINHGPTTSCYYRDPNRVKVEIQVDNSGFPGGARKFFDSKAFARNPVGIEFDPDDLVARFHSGEDAASLLRRPDQDTE